MGGFNISRIDEVMTKYVRAARPFEMNLIRLTEKYESIAHSSRYNSSHQMPLSYHIVRSFSKSVSNLPTFLVGKIEGVSEDGVYIIADRFILVGK